MPSTILTSGEAAAPHQRRKRKATKKRVTFGFGAFVAVAAGLITLLDLWDKTLIIFHIKADPAFVLAEKTEKGDLARNIVHSTSQRIFWARRYSGELSSSFPMIDQDEAWRHYNESVISWNENYLVYSFLSDKYFGSNVKTQYADLNWMLRAVNTCLNQVHYRSLFKGDAGICHLQQVGGIEGGNQDEQQTTNLTAIGKTMDMLDKHVAELIESVSK